MGHVRFLLTSLFVCVAAYLGLSLIGSSRFYCERTKSFADLSPCYKFSVRDQGADILLVGDSSLLYAIRPEVIRSLTGRTAYNYGLVGPVFAFDPRSVIDHYIATNRPPRAIIAYVSPWDIVEPGRIHDPVWFPIGLAAMQYPRVISFGQLLRARPSAIVELPPIIVSMIGLATGRTAALHHQMDQDLGYSDFASQLPAADVRIGHCPAGTPISRVPDTAATRRTMAELRARYAAIGIPLFVYIAPFAHCGARTEQVKRAFAGVSDNSPAALDDRLFARESGVAAHVHVNAVGSAEASRLLAQFVTAHGIGSPR